MKTQIQKLRSSKLFYNKWPYKVECYQHGASKIPFHSLSAIRDWCKTGKGIYFGRFDKTPDPKQYLEFIDAVEPFLKNENVRVRTERGHFNLFCMDQAQLEVIENRLRPWITKISGPTTQEELDFLLSNGHKKILCDGLPHEMYNYKIYFKSNFPPDKRQNFLLWSKKYGDKLNISSTTEGWLSCTKHYVQSPFMYVVDDKMLSMIGIYLSGNIRKVEEFILRENALTV
jgi:hypothetical protein